MSENWERIKKKFSGKWVEVEHFDFLGPLFVLGRNKNVPAIGFDVLWVDPRDDLSVPMILSPKDMVRKVPRFKR